MIDRLKVEQLNFFGWFGFSHYGVEQQFELTTSSGRFRVYIVGSGLPLHFDHPGPIAGASNDEAIVSKHLRVRPGFVISKKKKIGCRIGYDLAFDTVVAYDVHHHQCWRSEPITGIEVIAKPLAP